MSINDVGLWLACGLSPAVGDTNSAETGPFGSGVYSLDLLAGYVGFTVNEQDWIPQRAQNVPKRSGSDIIQYDVANVTETINIAVTGRSATEVAALVGRLERMAGLAREFWAGTSIEPPHIKWKAKGSPGPQYALIYNMNIADQTSGLDGVFSGALVLEVEREAYWRALPPGANPKLWTFEAAGLLPGVDYDYTDMSLNSGTDHQIYEAAVSNKAELDDSVETGVPTSFVSQNFIDVDDVPGDIDAGLFLQMQDASGNSRRYFVARKTLFPHVSSNAGNEQVHTNMLNACDAGVSITTTIEADTGAPIAMSTGTARRGKITFADTATHPRIQFPSTSGTMTQMNRFLGKWAVFLRCRQVGAGTVALHLRAGYTFGLTDEGGIRLMETPLAPVMGTSGDTTEWGLVYFGTVNIPFADTPASQAANGTGLKNVGTSGDLSFMLYATSSATTPTVYVSDLILMPIDEMAMVTHVDLQGVFQDSSGYAARGWSSQFVGFGTASSESMNAAVVEYAGNLMTMRPNATNRLYFLTFYEDGGVMKSIIGDTLTVRANYAPRWSGRRDV